MNRTTRSAYWDGVLILSGALVVGVFLIIVLLFVPPSPGGFIGAVTVTLAAASLFAAVVSWQNARLSESESDIDKLIATATSETATNVFHTTDAVLVDETVGVTDEVRAVLKQDAEQLERLKREGVQAQKSRKKSELGRRYGATILAGLFLILAAAVTSVFVFLKQPVPDCPAYATVLLEVGAAAPSNDSAIRAVEALTWDSLGDECGDPGEFLRELGNP